MFLVDTNVLSEFRKPRPDPHVVAWLHRAEEATTFISVVSLAELRRGIVLMQPGKKKGVLEGWLSNELPERFNRRVLNVTPPIAEAWGDMMAYARRRGIGLTAMDGFLAATAHVHALRIATRNEKDFAPLGVALFNPWTERA